MPEPKRTKKTTQPKAKTFEAQVDSFLTDLHVAPEAAEETASKPAAQQQARPVVNKLIDFIKKM